jgi:hypothetical protein
MDEMNIRVEPFVDGDTVNLNIYADKTDTQDPSKLKFLLQDGTELVLELSEGVEQADGGAVYEITGIKKRDEGDTKA